MSIFDIEFQDEKVKLPTLKQYLTKRKGKNIPKQFHVVLIWVPNKFPNFSIETEKFRLNVPDDSVFGKHLQQFVTDESMFECPIALIIGSSTDGTMTYKALRTKENGSWIRIDNETDLLGIRWEMV